MPPPASSSPSPAVFLAEPSRLPGRKSIFRIWRCRMFLPPLRVPPKDKGAQGRTLGVEDWEAHLGEGAAHPSTGGPQPPTQVPVPPTVFWVPTMATEYWTEKLMVLDACWGQQMGSQRERMWGPEEPWPHPLLCPLLFPSWSADPQGPSQPLPSPSSSVGPRFQLVPLLLALKPPTGVSAPLSPTAVDPRVASTELWSCMACSRGTWRCSKVLAS